MGKAVKKVKKEKVTVEKTAEGMTKWYGRPIRCMVQDPNDPSGEMIPATIRIGVHLPQED